MRFLKILVLVCTFATPTFGADLPSHKRIPQHWGACGDLCRTLDGAAKNCHLNERPYYDEDGQCTGCEPDPTCTR